jgi:ribosome-binding protein aMBF1 (putative translation factor)
MDSQMLNTGFYERFRSQNFEDPEFRAAYDRAAREIAQIDAVIQTLDALRVDLGMSKAELARRVGRNASSVRRLFTACGAHPELSLIVSLADALDAEVLIVPRQKKARRAATEVRPNNGRDPIRTRDQASFGYVDG